MKPKASQSEPKGNQKAAKGSQKEAKREPKANKQYQQIDLRKRVSEMIENRLPRVKFLGAIFETNRARKFPRQTVFFTICRMYFC